MQNDTTDLLPHDLETEKEIIGFCLRLPERIPIVLEQIDSHCFFSQKHADLFTEIKTLSKDGNLIPANLKTLTPLLHAELIDAAMVVTNISASCEKLFKVWQRRELIHLGNSVIMDCQEWDASAQEIASAFLMKLTIIGDKKQSDNNHLKDCLGPEIEQIIEAFERRSSRGIECHLPTLNRMLGGFHKGNLIVIGARPGVGKSALAVNFAYHAAMNAKKKIMVVSVEMSQSEIIGRLLSLHSMVPAELIINKPMFITHDGITKIVTAGDSLAEYAQIFLVHDAVTTAENIFFQANLAKSKMNGIDLVIVDYLQLLETRLCQRGASRAEYIASITRTLRTAAKRLNVPVIALAQIGRDGEGIRPTLKNFKESGEIEQSADVAIILYQDSDDGEHMFRLNVAKNRNGQTGEMRLLFIPDQIRFMEITHAKSRGDE